MNGPEEALQEFRSLTRVFVQPDRLKDGKACLDESQARHLVRVLRMQSGDRVGVLDGTGNAWIAVLEECRKSGAVARLVSPVANPHSESRRVELAVPLLKGEKLDLVLEKCTEMGVSAFHLFPARRSVARISDDAAAKLRRFRAICTSAAEQCGAFTLPDLHIWHSLQELLEHVEAPSRYVAWEHESPASGAAFAGVPGHCIVACGPEGGITHEEMDLWKRHGFQSVSLGGRILRAETAAIVLCALALCVPQRGEMG